MAGSVLSAGHLCWHEPSIVVLLKMALACIIICGEKTDIIASEINYLPERLDTLVFVNLEQFVGKLPMVKKNLNILFVFKIITYFCHANLNLSLKWKNNHKLTAR